NPVAVDDSVTVHGHRTIVPAENDTDPENDSVTFQSIATQPQYGTLTPWAPGAYTYWPNNGFVGTDSFTYTIHDSYGGEATGTVYINVVNVPPFAFPDLYYWKWGMHMTPAENDIDAEGDGVTFESIQTSTQFGVLNAWSAGTYTYMPTPGSGPLADYFLY